MAVYAYHMLKIAILAHGNVFPACQKRANWTCWKIVPKFEMIKNRAIFPKIESTMN